MQNVIKKKKSNIQLQLLKIIENIDTKKAAQQGDIPVRIIKENKFTFSKVLFEMI